MRIRQVEELVPKDRWNDAMKKVKDELRDIPTATMDDGSPHGASSVSGPMGEMTPMTNELEIAKTPGRRITEISRKISGN